jgi:hypothetical protein
MDLIEDRPSDLSSQVTVCRADGRQVPVRLRLLGYDGCEFETDDQFAVGERVSVHIFRMGSIRARIISHETSMVEAAFDQHCPV